MNYSSTGWDISMAVKTDGSLWAWGDNVYGQLGNGSVTESTSPVQVLSGDAATEYFYIFGNEPEKPKADGLYTYEELSDGTVRLLSYSGCESVIAIPSRIPATPDGKTVTALGSKLFFNNSTVTRITLPESIREIGRLAFADCPNLEKVAILGGIPEPREHDGDLFDGSLRATVYYDLMNYDWPLASYDSPSVSWQGKPLVAMVASKPEELVYMALSRAAYMSYTSEDIGKKLSEVFSKPFTKPFQNPGIFFTITDPSLPSVRSISNYEFLSAYAGDWTVAVIPSASIATRGFYGVALLSPDHNEVVLSFRGTQIDGLSGTDIWDLLADLGMATNMTRTLESQLNCAELFYIQVKDWCKQKKGEYENIPLVATGHSLGGAIASSMAYLFGLKTRTFNAPSITAFLFKTYPDHASFYFTNYKQNNLIDYVSDNCVIGNFGTGDSSIARTDFIRNIIANQGDFPLGGNLDRSIFCRRKESQSVRESHNLSSLLRYSGNPKAPLEIDSFANALNPVSSNQLFNQSGLYIATGGRTAIDVDASSASVVYCGSANNSVSFNSSTGSFQKSSVVGGKGNDVFFNARGDTEYFYHLRASEGMDSIEDPNGSDALYLTGDPDASKDIQFTVNSSYVSIQWKGSEITRIYKCRSQNRLTKTQNPFNVYLNREKLWNLADELGGDNTTWVSARCPVVMKIYDANHQLIQVLGNDAESFEANENGVFTVLHEVGTDDYIKTAGLFVDDCTIELVGTDTGTMDYEAYQYNDDNSQVRFIADDVPVSGSTVITTSSALDSVPTLSVQEGQDTSTIQMHGGTVFTIDTPATAGGVVSYSHDGKYLFGGETVTLTAKPASGYRFVGWVCDEMSLLGESETTFVMPQKDVTIHALWQYEQSIDLAPSHAILANTADTAVFQLISDTDLFEHGDIQWTVSDPGALTLTPVSNQKSVEIRAVEPITAKTVQITATVTDPNTFVLYTASATVELLPRNVDTPTIKLLDAEATVNKAKSVGALVPILITAQPLASFGILSLPSLDSASRPSPGTPVVTKIDLFLQNSKTKEWTIPLTTFTARMSPADARYIEINALPTAETTRNVKVVAEVNGSPVDAGILTLTVVEKYPKITLKADPLNLAFPDTPATLTAICADGACTITDITAPANTIVFQDGTLRLNGMAEAGNVKIAVSMAVAGYIQPYRIAPTIRVTVTDALPKLKLSPASVILVDETLGNEEASIALLSGNEKIPFETGYSIADVRLSDTDAKGEAVINAAVDVSYSGGLIGVRPKAGMVSGSALLQVTFMNSDEAVYLRLKVTRISADKLTASAKIKTVTVNQRHESGSIVTIPIALNAANYVLSNWYVLNFGNGIPFAGSALAEAISVTPYDNRITLSVINASKLESLIINNKDRKFVLNIGSDNIANEKTGKPKTFPVTLTISAKQPTFSVSTKGKIDSAAPGSAITASVKLTGTTSEIETVTLWTKPNDPLPANRSADFKAIGIDGTTFQIMAAHGEVVPGIKQNLSLTIKLQNGQTLNSWDSGKDKPMAVNPAQTVSKAFQSKKEVALYRATPLTGEAITLNLTTPAGVLLGEVRINQSSVSAMNFATGGFKLERSGEDTWTILFNDGKAPTVTNPNTGASIALKPSYTLKLELWANGTYQQNPDGSFKDCLRDSKGNPKSKPTLVSVKVNIK